MPSTTTTTPLTRGRVITPADGDYDEARTIMVGGFDSHPALIVRAADADDVATVVRYARDNGLELAVRSGGHSGAGHGSSDGGIVLDLRDMKTLDIDVVARTAWAQTGLTAAEFSTAVGAHGLAVGFGDTGSVGLGGITVGGGIGYLVRKLGLTIDSLMAAEIVTADGELLHVDAHDHPDLFWAIRGGGGNFGVVTRFQFVLHEVPQVVGGMLMLPATAETLAGFMAAAEAAPEELSAIVNVMPAPPMPFVPEEHHGSLVIMALMCHAGEADAGEAAMAPFRALATAIVDMVRPMPYAEIYPPEPGGDYHPTVEQQTLFLDSFDLSAARRIIEDLRTSDAPMRAVQLRVLGGAFARVPADATAFAHRASGILTVVVAFCESEQDRERRRAWVADLAGALRQGDAGAYVNFLTDEGSERIRAAYPGETWERLVSVKRKYDPTNLFHRNQNIPPA
jgi:FAD/FMN-containing dehydrogenase